MANFVKKKWREESEWCLYDDEQQQELCFQSINILLLVVEEDDEYLFLGCG